MMSRPQLRQHTPRLVILLLVLSLFLVACERPLTDGVADVEVTVVPAEDPDVGGGTDAELEPTVEEPEVEELPATAEPLTEEEEEEESAIPSEDPEGAIVPETEQEADEGITEEAAEAAEEVEEAVEEVEEAVEEVEEAVEEMEEPVAEATEEAAVEEAEGDGEAGGDVAEAEAEEATAETEAEVETSQLPATEQVHIVQPGENLFRIGLQYGISWRVLADYNDLANPYRIEVGQELLIPPADATDTPAPAEATTYVVQPGDNLYHVSRAFDVSWLEIAEVNELQYPYVIYPGQVLTIPGSGE